MSSRPPLNLERAIAVGSRTERLRNLLVDGIGGVYVGWQVYERDLT